MIRGEGSVRSQVAGINRSLARKVNGKPRENTLVVCEIRSEISSQFINDHCHDDKSARPVKFRLCDDGTRCLVITYLRL